MTLGVRGVVLDRENRCFLSSSSLAAGWHFAGRRRARSRTFRDALIRELAEEGRIELLGRAGPHGIFLNRHVSARPRRG